MSTVLGNVIVRHERRVRLVFTAQIVAGGFLTSSYAITSTDSLGASPSVVAVLNVPGNGNAAELQLSNDLVSGAVYAVSFTGITLSDGTSTATVSGSTQFSWGDPRPQANVEPAQNDYADLLYGHDLVHNGVDYVLTPEGDLAIVSGLPNAHGAVQRRVFGDPLAWDPSYSANSYEYVDGAPTEMPTLRGAIIAQARADDRVKEASCDVIVDATGTSARFDLTVWMIGGETPKTFSFDPNNPLAKGG